MFRLRILTAMFRLRILTAMFRLRILTAMFRLRILTAMFRLRILTARFRFRILTARFRLRILTAMENFLPGYLALGQRFLSNKSLSTRRYRLSRPGSTKRRWTMVPNVNVSEWVITPFLVNGHICCVPGENLPWVGLTNGAGLDICFPVNYHQ